MLAPDPATIERILREDVPSIDLTTTVLGLPSVPAQMTFRVRSPSVVAGLPLATGLLARCGATVTATAATGTRLDADAVVLRAEGTPAQLHLAWKVCAGVLEAACGIATRTAELLAAARTVAPMVEVLATRKLVPGTKELAVEAVLAGGALPHRLGLSETVLVFEQHTVFLGGIDGLIARLPQLTTRAGSKPVVVEVSGEGEAVALARAGVGGLQFDKLDPPALAAAVAAVRQVAPHVRLLAAGGITAANAADYAATGVDGLVTSWMYGGPGVDIGVRITPSASDQGGLPG
ncbi:MAG: ModD protein [Propionibacteriales bacterium]|nr:ModD protein [Propionibacteriales bacterium]